MSGREFDLSVREQDDGSWVIGVITPDDEDGWGWRHWPDELHELEWHAPTLSTALVGMAVRITKRLGLLSMFDEDAP